MRHLAGGRRRSKMLRWGAGDHHQQQQQQRTRGPSCSEEEEGFSEEELVLPTAAGKQGPAAPPLESLAQMAARFSALRQFDKVLTGKVQRKLRRHGGSNAEAALRETLSKFRGQEDVGCLEEQILKILPLKNRSRCMRHLYLQLLQRNELFLSMTKAVPEEERESFESKLALEFRRENIRPNMYLTVSPRGALYIVRRGAIRISMKGNVVATLGKGSVFEVCVLSNHYVTLHEQVKEHEHKLIETNSEFAVINDGDWQPVLEDTEEESSDEVDDENEELETGEDNIEDVVLEEQAESEVLNTEEDESSLNSNGDGLGNKSRSRRRSFVKAFSFFQTPREDAPAARQKGARRSLALKSNREVQTYPFSLANICALEASSIDEYSFGCELGVLGSDKLRSIVAIHPSVARNFEVQMVAVEVQVEREAEAQRQKREAVRRKLEDEHRAATNKELERACRAGSAKRVREAILAGASLSESLNESGATALHMAAVYGHADVVALLISLGADPQVVDLENRTPLHLCALVGSWDKSSSERIVNGLVRNESCLHSVDKWSNTCLHLAANTGDVEFLSTLMRKIRQMTNSALYLELRNVDKFTALELCTCIESKRILKPKTHVVANVR